jgi:hypothetical protein
VTSGPDRSRIIDMKIGWVGSLIVVVCWLAGCSTKEKYARNNLSSGGYAHYTVVLTKSADVLSGFYSPSVPFSQGDQAAVTLRRIGN